jgi:hypothetical protein
VIPAIDSDDSDLVKISSLNELFAENGINFNFMPDSNTPPVREPTTILLFWFNRTCWSHEKEAEEIIGVWRRRG